MPRMQVWLPALYVLGTTSFVYALFSAWGYDDPFITYRYARNLADGVGFVYNPGEQVLSTTTPLFALLLAALSPLWDDLPRLANAIGALSLALGGLCLWDLARSWKTPLAGWAALFLYPTFPLTLTTLGSETPLYLAFCLAAFAFYARERYGLTAAASALALLTRPDGALIPVILGADYLVRALAKRRAAHTPPTVIELGIPWGTILLFLGLALPWFVFAWLYFGSPLPATLATKQHQGAMAISERFAAGFLSEAGVYARRWQYPLEALLGLAGAGFMLWRKRHWLLFLSWPVLYFLAYTLLGVSSYYWYYAPLVPGFIALVGLGIAAGPQLLKRYGLRLPYLDGLALGLVALLTLAQVGHIWRLSTFLDPRVQAYRAVGEWLNTHTPPGASIATLEVGVIGFYAERPMVDFAGLIQPEVAAHLTSEATYQDAAVWAVVAYRPDYLVLQEGQFSQVVQGYAAHCHVVEHFPGAVYGHKVNLDIYACP